MNLQHIVARLFFVGCVATTYGWSDYASSQPTPKVPKGLQAVASQFAHSYILGTGESHFLTTVRPIDAGNAVAVVGVIGNGGRDPNAYTVYLNKINGKWKVVRYEFIFRPTGKKESRDQVPPFPYPGWEKHAP
jgi:hypothetical protein